MIRLVDRGKRLIHVLGAAVILGRHSEGDAHAGTIPKAGGGASTGFPRLTWRTYAQRRGLPRPVTGWRSNLRRAGPA